MTQTSQTGFNKKKLAVIGAGSWGTVLAWLLAQNGPTVKLWARRPALAKTINETHSNQDYLPSLKLPRNLSATSHLIEAVEGVSAAVIAVPSKGLRDVLSKLPEVPALISCSKGLEIGSFKRFSEVVAEYQPEASLAALSGPNLAKEIAAGLPAAATLASQDKNFAREAQGWFNSETFRIYTSRDIIGVEIAGAMKNVIALAAGMCDGLKLGDNAKATIITRGLNEIIRLGTHLGGDAKTFYGLAGLGDMVATCASAQSRNHTAGELFVGGASLKDIDNKHLTAEGIPTVKAVNDFALKEGLELPICNEVYRVIYEHKKPHQAISDLMGREAKAE